MSLDIRIAAGLDNGKLHLDVIHSYWKQHRQFASENISKASTSGCFLTVNKHYLPDEKKPR